MWRASGVTGSHKSVELGSPRLGLRLDFGLNEVQFASGIQRTRMHKSGGGIGGSRDRPGGYREGQVFNTIHGVNQVGNLFPDSAP